MKNEPCVRFGIFMSPKISENPADRRKSSPPSVMLLTASTTHRFMLSRFERRLCRRHRIPGGGREGAAQGPSRFQWWVVAGGHRLRQGPFLVVGPELAPFGIGPGRGVDGLVARLIAP